MKKENIVKQQVKEDELKVNNGKEKGKHNKV